MGYGGILQQIKDQVKDQANRLIKIGQSGTKRALQELQEVIIWTKLIRINDVAPEKNIQGFIRIKLSSSVQQVVAAAKFISAKSKKTIDDIKITLKRIR